MFLFSLLVTFTLQLQALSAEPEVKMAKISAGTYQSFFKNPKTKKSETIRVSEFYLDITPVTNEQFRRFLKENSKWNIESVPRIFADKGYLKHWINNFSPDFPVVNVSWFAAQSYCESKGKRLPTVNEWEYAAFDPKDTKVILEWYSSPNKLFNVGEGKPNKFGVYNLNGLVWEWVEDFNSVMLPGRGDSDMSKLFCGSGALGTADPTNYATFLRYGFRSSLRASYTVENLGFRCARGNL